MTKSRTFVLPLAFFSVFLLAEAAPAETIELVTYYPTQANTGDLHVGSLTVGDAYRNVTPGDGEALLFDALGIGLPVGNPVPAGPLHVVGVDGGVSSAIFVPGTGAGSEIRVGIGLNNPTTRLAVGGLLQSQIAQDARYNVQLGYLAPSGMPSIGFSANLHADTTVNLVSNTRPARAVVITAADDALSFSRNANGAAQDAAAFNPTVAPHPMMVMRLDSGNVGIGTAAPTVRLDVAQNNAVRVGNAYLSSGDSTPVAPSRWAHFGLDAWFRGDQWIFTNPGRGISLVQLQNDSISFFTNADSTFAGWANRMHINAAGNVGIRTTAPQKPLHVRGGVAFEGNHLHIRNPSSPASGRTWGFVVGTADGDFAIGRAGDAIPIGGALPGKTHIFMERASGRTIIADPYTLSDARLKTQITPIRGALEKMDLLRGVQFRWKDDPDGVQLHMGLLAQEAEKAFPNLVSTNSEGIKSVASAGMIGVLVEAVKELKAQNEALRKQAESDRERIEKLERRLADGK